MPLALVVGAGIGGMAAGLSLRRAGWDVRIFERAAAPRSDGFALGLAPNAIAALRELRLGDAIALHAMTPTVAEIRRVDGHVIRRFAGRREDLPVGDLPSVILRPALHRALVDALGPGSVEAGQSVVRFHVDGMRVRAEMAHGQSVIGDILIGADGVASLVRAQLHPDERPARPSGYFAVRGLSPAVTRLEGLHALWYFGRGVESGVVQASPQSVYWFVSLRADDVRSGPADVDSVMRRATPAFDAQFHAITGATPAADLRLDELFVREPLRTWGAGPVTLLGDAAHPMLPHTGQGAAQALEDAVGLGRAMRAGGNPIAALRRYEEVRSRRTRKVVTSGPWIARITTTKSAAIGFLRDRAIVLVPGTLLTWAMARPAADPHRALGPP